MPFVLRAGAWTVAFFSLAGTSLPARAQGAADEPIIVTGERQHRTVEETSSSVAVFTRGDVEARSADRLDQLLANVPNVQLGSGGEGPTIRGQDSSGVLRDLPAFLGGTRPRATLQVDGRAVGYNELVFGTAPLWDVAQIEVFRSPQTTTQGRNSIAGAIFIQTVDPTFAWEGRGRALAGTNFTRQFSGSISGPLVEDQLAFRASADMRRGRSSSELTTTAAGIDPNRDVYDLFRLKLMATPSAVQGLRLVATVARTASQAPQIEGIRPPYARRQDPQATYGIFKTGVTSATVRGEQTFSPRLNLTATASLGGSEIRRFAPAGFGETRIAGNDRSFEFVSNWRPVEGLRIIGGVHALDNELDQYIDLSAARLGRGTFNDHQSSLGVFGEAEWEILPRVTLTGGGRYQRDQQTRSGKLAIGAREVPLAYRGVFEEFLPKVSLAYGAGEGGRVGFMVQRSYNPGGATLNLATFAPDTFGAETMWAYEAFGRMSRGGGRLTVSGNLFHYAIRNAQRTLLRELITPGGVVLFVETANAPRAHARGSELAVGWRPNARLALDAALGLLDTKLTQTLSASDSLRGKEFQRSPHVTASVAIKWQPAAAITLSAQWRHGSGYFSDDANTPGRRISSASTADARIEWVYGSLNVFAYARNLFDKFYLTYRFASGDGLATAGDPRELGIGVEARF